MSLLSTPLPREATPETPVTDAVRPEAERAHGGLSHVVPRLRTRKGPGSISEAVVKLWRFGRAPARVQIATLMGLSTATAGSSAEEEQTAWAGSEPQPALAPQPSAEPTEAEARDLSVPLPLYTEPAGMSPSELVLPLGGDLLDDLEGPARPNARADGTIIRHFLLWARSAPADHRADAVDALARAILQGDLSPQDRDEAELALLAMLDDPAPSVRHAIATALAPSADAPRLLLSGLLQDRSEIAAAVLEFSPVLSDTELVDYVALRDGQGQCAIARRAAISPGLAGALAEVGALAAVLAMLANPGARVTEGSLMRIVERFGDDPAVREVLLRRPDLPVEIRLSLAAALTKSISGLAARAGGAEAERLEQRTREACERAIVTISCGADRDLARRMVTHLRASGQLTPGLILRATLSHALTFVESAVAELTGVGERRAAAILKQGGAAADALYRSAGLPESLKPTLLGTLPLLYDDPGPGKAAGLSRRLIERALAASAGQGNPSLAALLEHYAAEAAREEARLLAKSVVAEAKALELTTDDLVAEAARLAAHSDAIEEGSVAPAVVAWHEGGDIARAPHFAF